MTFLSTVNFWTYLTPNVHRRLAVFKELYPSIPVVPRNLYYISWADTEVHPYGIYDWVVGVLSLLIDFVFPKRCVGCGKWEVFLCQECRVRMTKPKQICPMCCKESVGGVTHERCGRKWGMEGLRAVYAYKNSVVRAVVDGIKFGFNKKLVGLVLEKIDMDMDMVVPVPLHWYRENWRGFNQAEEIAREVGGDKVRNVLVRVKKTRQQARIESKNLRVENVEGAFSINSNFHRACRQAGFSIFKNKKVLLVDDVFTSGASMRECAKVLKKAGVGEVWGFVLAR